MMCSVPRLDIFLSSSVHPYMFLVDDRPANLRPVRPVASCRAEINSLHLSWSAASLCIMPQMCCKLLMHGSTVLHQVACGWSFFFFGCPSGGSFSDVAGSLWSISLFDFWVFFSLLWHLCLVKFFVIKKITASMFYWENDAAYFGFCSSLKLWTPFCRTKTCEWLFNFSLF